MFSLFLINAGVSRSSAILVWLSSYSSGSWNCCLTPLLIKLSAFEFCIFLHNKSLDGFFNISSLLCS